MAEVKKKKVTDNKSAKNQYSLDPLNAEDDKDEFKIPQILKLNIGGVLYTTRKATIMRYTDSMLAVMFSGRYKIERDDNGYFFIDRDGEYFQHILEFLRDKRYVPPLNVRQAVHREADFYGLAALVENLEKLPPLFPYKLNRKDPIEDYPELKNQLLEHSSNQIKAMAGGKTEVHMIFFKFIQDSLKSSTEYKNDMNICLGEAKHVRREIENYFEHAHEEFIMDPYSLHVRQLEEADKEPDPLTLSTDKATSKEQALAVISCLTHDFQQMGYQITYKLEDCQFEPTGLSKQNFDTLYEIPVYFEESIVYVYKDKNYGEKLCTQCYCHCKFVFNWT